MSKKIKEKTQNHDILSKIKNINLKSFLKAPKESIQKILPESSFLNIALNDFIAAGAVAQSTRWSAETVTRHIPRSAESVAEYGPGNGIISKYILGRLSQKSKLYAIELNPEFVKELGKIVDSRLIVKNEDILHFADHLKEFEPNGLDVVVSGIPFSFMTPKERETIVEHTKKALKPTGKFIVYQYSPLMYPVLKRHFRSVSFDFEPRNIFPYFIMIAEP